MEQLVRAGSWMQVLLAGSIPARSTGNLLSIGYKPSLMGASIRALMGARLSRITAGTGPAIKGGLSRESNSVVRVAAL